MSNYFIQTKHPKTGEWELAEWLDNCFGHHKYGIRFPSDEQIYDFREHDFETNDKLDLSKKGENL